MCKEEERNSSLVQEEPQPLQIKDEQQEQLLQRPEEAAGSTLTSLAVKREDDENRDTEPLASTSTEHMETQAHVEICGASQPTSDDQLLSSHRSESDSEDSDFWEETREPKSSKQTPSPKTHTGKESCRCAECGRTFSSRSLLERHMRTCVMDHTPEKRFSCTVCSKSYSSSHALKVHMGMGMHTGDSTCTECGKWFLNNGQLKRHMMIHTGEKPFTCMVCWKSFSRKSTLKNHMNVLHPQDLVESKT